jgi:E3 ubiquitin-protein ligase SHPRH
MANRLKAINRWCVTGTPIGRSLDDLYGLFTFIREDPYLESKWFKETLYKPYVTNDKEPMAKAVSKVLWRTAKKYVEDQVFLEFSFHFFNLN